jgi:hypothetical protein
MEDAIAMPAAKIATCALLAGIRGGLLINITFVVGGAATAALENQLTTGRTADLGLKALHTASCVWM